ACSPYSSLVADGGTYSTNPVRNENSAEKLNCIQTASRYPARAGRIIGRTTSFIPTEDQPHWHGHPGQRSDSRAPRSKVLPLWEQTTRARSANARVSFRPQRARQTLWKVHRPRRELTLERAWNAREVQ